MKSALFGCTISGLIYLSTGCTTNAYCFSDCDENGANNTSADAGVGGNNETTFNTSDAGCTGTDCFNTTSTNTTCAKSNGGIEICDDVDNDCNGVVDDVLDEVLDSPDTCGTCSNNCYTNLTNCTPTSVTCTVDTPGEAGTCTCGECATDYFDLDNNGTCEYYCLKTADDDTLCNNKDDDCDGVKDNNVDLCSSTTDCGKCGHACSILHGTGECVNDGTLPCDSSNTACQIAACDCEPGNCWWDLDNSTATGCEYQCELTEGGIEICGDSIDNDCDGYVDEADSDLSGDPQIGQPCFGDPDGLCATDDHAGITACQSNKVVCIGNDVIVEGEVEETCNDVDDDCNGEVDDNPTDVGDYCGTSNIYPCSFGTIQCNNGVATCTGAVEPTTETCNGQDDDCDGNIDKTGILPPSDSIGECDVPIDPPAGATSPCQAGSLACVGGVTICQGSETATSSTDSCGDDSNCDGVLTGQPNLTSDVNHCGSCSNDCEEGTIHANWSCASSKCVFEGCESGYYDLDNDNSCEYACIYIQAQEACNGVDDNCDGDIDEGVTAPSAVQVCGVSPSATSDECTSDVSVACVNGSWKCTFPTGVCSPNCATATEICDSYDNDCDGALNENVSNYGSACASDDGLPSPGHGACQTTGTYVCSGNNATVCSATKADCSSLPDGCTETCDGIDNDCDGSIDEAFNSKGSNSTYFVKPNITKIGSSTWVYSYEASRPNATSTSAGTGNGYHTSAPTGETLDSTYACSVSGKIPWFNVTPSEVDQTCTAMGGHICTTTEWQTACTPSSSCDWGYYPSSSGCSSSYTTSKYCNLGPSYDFDSDSGDQDGLLATASSLLKNCWADWAGLQSNTSSTNKIYDLTGNLREITSAGSNEYTLMGGAFNTQSEDGATCDFTFYTVDDEFKFYDTGFRCCFSSNPTQ